MNEIVGFGVCFQRSARFLFNAAQTNLVSYPRPETAKVATAWCRIVLAREDSGCCGDGAGEQKLCQLPVWPCPRRQQCPGGPCFQPLSVTSPVQSSQPQRPPRVSLPRLRKEQDQRRESSPPKFMQVFFLVVYPSIPTTL